MVVYVDQLVWPSTQENVIVCLNTSGYQLWISYGKVISGAAACPGAPYKGYKEDWDGCLWINLDRSIESLIYLHIFHIHI